MPDESRQPRASGHSVSRILGRRRLNAYKNVEAMCKLVVVPAETVLILVMLALAVTLDSPMYPGRKQSQPSSHCPKPQLFEAWMGFTIAHGVVISVLEWWIYIRRRAMNRQSATALAAAAERRARFARWSESQAAFTRSQRDLNHVRPHTNTSSNVWKCSRWQLSRVRASIPQPSMGSESSPRGTAGSVMTPPLSPPTNGPSSPPMTEAQASTSVLSLSQVWRGNGSLGKSSSGSSWSLSPSRWTTQVTPLVDLAEVHLRCPADPRGQGLQSSIDNEAAVQSGNRHTTYRRQELEHVGPYPEPYIPAQERRQMRNAAYGYMVDDICSAVLKSDRLFKLVPWILGHVLVFCPSPTAPSSCYRSSPMLWWGVMAPLILTYITYAEVLVRALIAFCRFSQESTSRQSSHTHVGLIEMTMAPSYPAPVPLSNVNLLRCNLVCYVPDPKEAPPSPPASFVALHSNDASKTYLPLSASDIDVSRLPCAPVVLPAHRAKCSICHENFAPPREAQKIMYEAPALRQLPCGHVYHCDCVDTWLLRRSDKCPYCNASVSALVEETMAFVVASRSPSQEPTARCVSGRTSALGLSGDRSRRDTRTSSIGSTIALPAAAACPQGVARATPVSRPTSGFDSRRASALSVATAAGASTINLNSPSTLSLVNGPSTGRHSLGMGGLAMGAGRSTASLNGGNLSGAGTVYLHHIGSVAGLSSTGSLHRQSVGGSAALHSTVSLHSAAAGLENSSHAGASPNLGGARVSWSSTTSPPPGVSSVSLHSQHARRQSSPVPPPIAGGTVISPAMRILQTATMPTMSTASLDAVQEVQIPSPEPTEQEKS